MNNSRQLMLGWIQYYTDSDDRLVNNFDGPNVQSELKNMTYRSWANNLVNWSFQDTLGNWNTNYDGITKAPFYRYTANIGIYKCPADNYASPLQRAVGGPLSWRPRSYSMNCFFGATTPTYTKDGNAFHDAYRQFYKSGSVPSPSNLYVLLEEHPDSINDGYFQNDAEPDPTKWKNDNGSQYWNDIPGSNHAGSIGVAFADGHSEVHKWKSSVCTIYPVKMQPLKPTSFTKDPAAAYQDAKWLAQRSSVLR